MSVSSEDIDKIIGSMIDGVGDFGYNSEWVVLRGLFIGAVCTSQEYIYNWLQ